MLSSVDNATSNATAAIVHAFGVEILNFDELGRCENVSVRTLLVRNFECTKKPVFFKTGLIIGMDPLIKSTVLVTALSTERSAASRADSVFLGR